ncbi:hypothetical protein [Haloarcula amylovorans]|uniref:hypothetical protein n=1 Tax=Haloarcula amylovorans TaxID=2562280 RepID=UPI00107641E5|nr:hypothetical protein [Halomicroarcula amylolytica]
MVSPPVYQADLLADTIQKATTQGLLGPKEAEVLQTRVQGIDSLEEAHELWNHIEEEYDILESQLWDN